MKDLLCIPVYKPKWTDQIKGKKKKLNGLKKLDKRMTADGAVPWLWAMVTIPASLRRRVRGMKSNISSIL